MSDFAWVSLFGQFDDLGSEIVFRGYTFEPEGPRTQSHPTQVEMQILRSS